jgi:SAM-dependent methyltransferase
MSTLSALYRDATQRYQSDETLINLLRTYGNILFDSEPSRRRDIIAGARWLRGCPLPGPILDIGAGEGAAALLLACLVGRPVIAVEMVAERAARIAERAARFGIDGLTTRHADAFTEALGDAAGLYVYTPFFDRDSTRLVDKLARECRPGTRIYGLGLFAKILRGDARFREVAPRNTAFMRATMVLV